jgi:hypothetical protein
MKKILFTLLFCLTAIANAQNNYTLRANFLPDSSCKRDIGNDTLYWEHLWVSELESTVFSKQSINLVGGYLRLGKNCGVIQGKVIPQSTTMRFESNMTIGDIVELRDAGKHEYVRILSLQADYNYYVARNLDKTGADTWLKGTPYSVIGQNGNGWIDIKSYDKTAISMYAVHDTTYNNWNEILRIGDLSGNWGYSGEQYGMVVGSYMPNSSFITIDTVNGIRIRHRPAVGVVADVFRVEPDGDAYFTGNVTLSNQASITLSGFNNDAGFITSASAGNHTYYQANAPTANEGDFWFDTDDYAMFRKGASTWSRVSVYMDGSGLYAGSITAGQITSGLITSARIVADSIKAGTFTGLTFQTAASGQRISISSATNSIYTYDATGLAGSLNSTGGFVSLTAYSGRYLSLIGGNNQSLYLDDNSNLISTSCNFTVDGVVTATGGNSTDWNEAHANQLALGTGATNAAYGNHNHSGVYAPAAEGATYSSHSATSGRYVATSSGGSPTSQMGWVVLTINGVGYTVFTSN